MDPDLGDYFIFFYYFATTVLRNSDKTLRSFLICKYTKSCFRLSYEVFFLNLQAYKWMIQK